MSILEKLRERRESKKLTATENWKALVCKVATDPKIDINLVDQKLDEFGKSETDLKNAVELFHKLREAEAVVEAGEGIREKIRDELNRTFKAYKHLCRGKNRTTTGVQRRRTTSSIDWRPVEASIKTYR